MAVPASRVFTTHEQKRYRRYQRTQTTLPSHKQGFLPTAKEYLAFQCWLKRRDSGYLSDTPLSDLSASLSPGSSSQRHEGKVASLCQHTLHPSRSDDEQLCCPVCTVESHMRYLQLLKKDWQPCNPRSGMDDIYYAWRNAKLDLIRTVQQLETYAAQEQDWATRHPEASVQNAKTAERALQIYYTAMEHDWMPPSSSLQSSESDTSSVMSTTSSSSSTSSRYSNEAKPARRVSFAADTSFDLGRPNPYFWRLHPRYEAGKYAVAATLEVEPASEIFGFGASTEEKGRDKGVDEHEHEHEHEWSEDEGTDDDSDQEDEDEDDEEEEDEKDDFLKLTAPFRKTTQESKAQTPKKASVLPDATVRDGHASDKEEQEDADSDSDSEYDSEEEEEEVEAGDFIVFEEDTSFIVFGE
jgi:hypothetical protein